MTERVLGDFPQFVAAFRRQLQFYLRTWRFIGLLLFVGAVSGLALAISLYLGPADAGVSTASSSIYLEGFVGNLGITAILVAAFLGGDAIAMDFGSARGYFMLVQPVRREVLLAGRFVAAFLASLAISLAYLGLAVIGAAYFFGVGALPFVSLGMAIGLLALTILGALSVAFCISASVKSPEVSIITSVLVLYLGLSGVSGGAAVAGVEPWFSLQYGASGISNVFAPTIVHAAPIGFGVPGTAFSPYVWEAAVILVAYVVVFVPLTVLLYQRKESQG